MLRGLRGLWHLRSLLLAAASAAVALTQTGCLWVPGAATAVVLLTSEDDDSEPGPPSPPPDVVLRGPFIPLEGTPADVVVGDFLRRGGEDPSPQDVAILSSDRLSIRFFRGDGAGRLLEDVVVPLSPEASIPGVGLAVIRLPGSGGDGLAVVTASSLEYLEFDAAGGAPALGQAIRLDFERGRREIEIGDFDGDGVPDAAVSSQEDESVEIFPGRLVGGSLRFDPNAGPLLEELGEGSVVATFRSPRAIAVANFDADPDGLSDLAVLEVESLTPTVRLYLSRGDGRSFSFQDQCVLPDANVDFGAALDAVDGALFGADDPFPDLLLNRETRVSKVLVTELGDGRGPRLQNFPQATGPAVRRPVSPHLMRLPREPGPASALWDVVVGDEERQTVALAYADTDGIAISSRIEYPVPGEPQAVAVGDLDGDSRDDVVAVCARPATLSILLSNPAEKGVEDDPLFHPWSGIVGENAAASPPGDPSYGTADGDGLEPFLAFRNPRSDEVTVVHLDPDTWAERSRERHPEPGTKLRAPLSVLCTADVDGIPGDEIVGTSRTGSFHILTRAESGSASQGPRFRLERLFDLLDPSEVPCRTCGPGHGATCAEGPPPGLAGAGYRARDFSLADLDGDGLPDLAVPITVSGPVVQDYVAVVLDPLGAREATFYTTGDAPRHVKAADADGDGAIDLLVACEGPDPAYGNRIHVLRGDPQAPGRFLLEGLDEWSIPGICHLDADTGDCIPDELEFVVTDNDASGFDARARAIVVATKHTVEVYFNRSVPGKLDVVGPCRVYEGMDPEWLILRDICGDPAPELLVADEDSERIIIHDNVYGFDHPACANPWEAHSRPIDKLWDSQFFLAQRPGSSELLLGYLSVDSEIVLYRGQAGFCAFDRKRAIPVEKPDRTGGRSGLAAAVRPDGGRLIASAVEDRDRPSTAAAIDFLEVPPGTTSADLRSLGSRGSALRGARMILEKSGTPSCLLFASLEAAGALPDLLIANDASGIAFRLPGELVPFLPGGVVSSDVVLEPLWRLGMNDVLVGWERVPLTDPPGAVLLGTKRDAYLFCPLSRRALWARGSGPDAIRGVSHGFTDRAGGPRLDRLFVAILTDRGLEVRAPESGKESVLAVGATGIVGCHDLDGDRRDDVILVDPTAGSLQAFLHERPLRFRGEASFGYGSSQDPVDMAFGDLNGDGRTDVCVGMEDGTVFAFLGDGRFRDDGLSAVRVVRTYAGTKLEALRLEDLDGDGKDEILASVAAPGLVVLTDWSDLAR